MRTIKMASLIFSLIAVAANAYAGFENCYSAGQCPYKITISNINPSNNTYSFSVGHPINATIGQNQRTVTYTLTCPTSTSSGFANTFQATIKADNNLSCHFSFFCGRNQEDSSLVQEFYDITNNGLICTPHGDVLTVQM